MKTFKLFMGFGMCGRNAKFSCSRLFRYWEFYFHRLLALVFFIQVLGALLSSSFSGAIMCMLIVIGLFYLNRNAGVGPNYLQIPHD